MEGRGGSYCHFMLEIEGEVRELLGHLRKFGHLISRYQKAASITIFIIKSNPAIR